MELPPKSASTRTSTKSAEPECLVHSLPEPCDDTVAIVSTRVVPN